MKNSVIIKYLSIIVIIISIIFIFLNLINQKKEEKTEVIEPEETYNSNIIKDVNYTSTDVKGNSYTIYSKTGEIDINNSGIIYLTGVTANIKLKNSETISITSKFGKYNINSYETIFSKNVNITYLDNNIQSEYLDFSINKNLMIISKNVKYYNDKNILFSDVIEMNLDTKDTKIFMHNVNEKVNIKSIK